MSDPLGKSSNRYAGVSGNHQQTSSRCPAGARDAESVQQRDRNIRGVMEDGFRDF